MPSNSKQKTYFSSIILPLTMLSGQFIGKRLLQVVEYAIVVYTTK